MVMAGGDVGRTRRGCGEAVPIIGERFCRPYEERQLTVQKTSLFSPGDGFAVYEHHRRRGAAAHCAEEVERHHQAEGEEESGELVFRVDSYAPNPHQHAIGKGGRARDELILMAPDGDCILTVRRKWPSLHQRWEGFLGERVEGQKPIFSIRKHSIIGRLSAGIGVEVYSDQLGGGTGGRGPGHLQYRVEGSFSQRCCAVFEVRSDGGEEDGDEGQQVGGPEAVAEIRRKVVPSGSAVADAAPDSVVVLGRDVFWLLLAPGFDAAFAMGLVLMLDRMTGDDDDDEGDGVEIPSSSGQLLAPADDAEDLRPL